MNNLERLCDNLMRSGWSIVKRSGGDIITVGTQSEGVRVSLTLMPDGDYVLVHRLRAVPELMGGGGRAMRDLILAANEERVTLTLCVTPFGPQTLDSSELRRFYEKHGFEADEDLADWMVRHHREPELLPSP